MCGTHPRTARHRPGDAAKNGSGSEVPQYFILDPDALQDGEVSRDCWVKGHGPDPDLVVCDRHATEHAHRACDTLQEEGTES